MAQKITQRGKVFYCRWDDPKGPDGKRKPRSHACRRPDGSPMNRQEAKEELARILAYPTHGPYPHLCIVQSGKLERVIGCNPILLERFTVQQLVTPQRVFRGDDKIWVREAELAGGVQMIYLEEPEDCEVLIWHKDLSPGERAQILTQEPWIRE